MTAESWGSRGWWGQGWAEERWQRPQPLPSSCSSNGYHLCPSWQKWALHTLQNLQGWHWWHQCPKKWKPDRHMLGCLITFTKIHQVSCLRTLFPGKGNDICGTLAHHFGDIEGAICLIGYGDGAVDGLSLHLKMHKARFISYLIHKLTLLTQH